MKALLPILLSLVLFTNVRADPAQDVIDAEGEEGVVVQPTTQPEQPKQITVPFDPTEPQPFLLLQSKGRMCLFTQEKAIYHFHQMKRYFVWEGPQSTFNIENLSDGPRLYWHLDIAGPGWYILTVTQAKDGSIHVISEISGRSPQVDGKWVKDYKSLQDLLQVKGSDDDVAQTVHDFMRRIGLSLNFPRRDVMDCLLFDKKLSTTDEENKEFEILVLKLGNDAWRVREQATEKLSDPKFVYLLNHLDREKLTLEQMCRVDYILSAYNCLIPMEIFEQLRK